MEHKITASEDGKYILITITGDITRTTAMKVNIEAHVLGRTLGIHSYLVDLTNSRNVDSVVDDYEFAYDDMRTEPQIDQSARVALFVQPDDHSHDFFATVSVNAGMRVSLFRDRDMALHYLLNV